MSESAARRHADVRAIPFQSSNKPNRPTEMGKIHER